MARVASAAVSVERFFAFSLWGLVTSGYLAVAASGYLDPVTTVVTAAGLLVRALVIFDWLRLRIPERAATAAAVAFAGFFPLDYRFVSHEFLDATIHLVFGLIVVKVLTARTSRDYLFTAALSFLELLAAAILSFSPSFFLFLALYLVFAMAAFTSGEIRRSLERSTLVARSGPRRFHGRLATLTVIVTVGILGLTGGLFFLLPRTAGAAFERLGSERFYLPGFSRTVLLGQIGEIKNSSVPVMHVRFFNQDVPGGLKWRGTTLSHFDGRRWENRSEPETILPADGRVFLAGANQRLSFRPHLNYEVELNSIETDVLFFAGHPEVVDIKSPRLLRTESDCFRLGTLPRNGFHYSVYSSQDWPDEYLSPEMRQRSLQLPERLDHRIRELAERYAATAKSDLESARAVETRLRSGYRYTIELPRTQVPDPLAYFLFQRRKGHCEYFASAMVVMLRTLGIPARLVNGFQSGTFNPLTGLYVIRASDAHSWVEAWIEGRGWTVFDPTPPDPGPGAFSLSAKIALYVDAAETFWRDWVLSYNLERQATLAGRVGESGRSFGARWADALLDARLLWKELRTHAWLYAPWLTAFLAAIGIMRLLAPRGVRRWRMRRGVQRLRRGEATIADATLLYQRMLDVLRRRGFEKPAWYTPREFAAAVAASDLGPTVARFTSAYNALRFGGDRDAAPRLSELLEELERLEA